MFHAYFAGLRDPVQNMRPRLPKPEQAQPQVGATPKDGVSRRFDEVFASYADMLPLPFIRALAQRESSMNPKENKGSYWGILQVGLYDVLPSYNKRFGTKYEPQDLFNPNLNTKIALELINRIARAYANTARESPVYMANLVPNFSNPEFVRLLVAGWNSGYSRAAGVQKVARWLASHEIPVTHDNVFKFGKRAGSTKWLHGGTDDADRKHRWQAGVQRLFFKMEDFTPLPAEKPPTRRPGGGGALVALSLVGLLGLLASGRA